MDLDVTRVINNKQSLLEIYEEGAQLLIRKTAKPGGEKDIFAQVAMLRELPAHLSLHYPELLDWNLSTPPPWYSMRFYNYPTLRSLLFTGHTRQNSLERKFADVLDFLFEQHYAWKTSEPNTDFIEQTYQARMLRRMDEIKESEPLFAEIFSARTINYDGRVFEQPAELLLRIMEDRSLRKKLEPEVLCSIHGQMEFDHILIRPDFEVGPDFVLLDPRGVATLSDPAYDLGKIWQSARSMVDLLENEMFEVNFSIRNEAVKIDFEYKLPHLHRSTAAFYSAIRAYIYERFSSKQDPNLVLRADFAEAIHLCSAVPFYYEGPRKLKRAVSVYLLGVLSMNNFVRDYC